MVEISGSAEGTEPSGLVPSDISTFPQKITWNVYQAYATSSLSFKEACRTPFLSLLPPTLHMDISPKPLTSLQICTLSIQVLS